MERAINLTFHGVGEPQRRLDPGEANVWVSRERFLSMLDSVADRADVRITFDDGNASDVEHALPALRERGLNATFFVVAGRLGAPRFLDAAAVKRARGRRDDDRLPRHAPSRRGAGSTTARCARSSSTPRRSSRTSSAARSRRPRARSAPTTAASCAGCAGRATDHVYTSDRGTTRSREFLQARNSIGPHDEPAVLEHIARLEAPVYRALPRRAKLAVKRWR